MLPKLYYNKVTKTITEVKELQRRNPNLKLKGLRAEYNLKQIDVAKMIGISEATYNRKENGITEFTEFEIKRICDIFKKNPTEIFFTNIATKETTEDDQAATLDHETEP